MRRDFEVRTYGETLAEYQLERSDPDWEPVRLGFGTIDAELRGISLGQVAGVAARTSVGKTWLLASIEHNFSVRRDAGCLSLSLEMPAVEWAERALAIHERVAPEQVEGWAKAGDLVAQSAAFLERMRNALLVEEAVALDDLPGVFDQARARLNGVPLRLVMIDYLGLLDAAGKDAYERASMIGKGLKRVAKAEKVAIVVAMQLSRAGGDGSEPVTKEMLRDSGVLEEALDFLIGAWRPGKEKGISVVEQMELKDVLRVALLKNRKGADGRFVDLRFHPDSRQLTELTDPFVEAAS